MTFGVIETNEIAVRARILIQVRHATLDSLNTINQMREPICLDACLPRPCADSGQAAGDPESEVSAGSKLTKCLGFESGLIACFFWEQLGDIFG